jgi:hypothetical protein
MQCRFQCLMCVKQIDPFHLFILGFYSYYQICWFYYTRNPLQVSSIIPRWFKTTINPDKVSLKIKNKLIGLTLLSYSQFFFDILFILFLNCLQLGGN